MSGHEHLSRRAFLGRAAGGAATVAGAVVIGTRIRDRQGPPAWDAAAFPPPGSARVAITRASSYDVDLSPIVREGLVAIGADVDGANVVLKPNLVEFDEGSSINTDPRLVAATVLAVRRLGAASVTVAEGPGHRRDTRYVVSASGLAESLASVEAPFVDLNTAEALSVRTSSHFTPLGELWLPKLLTSADVVISMPKMKTHHWAGVTLSLKNCFGCLPGRVYGWPKNILHWVGIDEAIVDIAGAVRPRYAIIDGIVGMEGNGPIDGSSIDASVLVFGDDPVAADTVGASLMGMDPTRIPYLQMAAQFLGQGDPQQILQVGEDPSAFSLAFEPAPGAAFMVAGSALAPPA
jgi:uncharacterized protein (DUF362 family)